MRLSCALNHLLTHLLTQEEKDEDNGNSVAASAAFTGPWSPHHSADTAADVGNHETTRNEEQETENGTRKTGSGYEGLDPHEVEEARLRAQRPSEYVGLQRDNVEDLYSLQKKKKR